MSRKLSIEEIVERRIFTPGQRYIQDYVGRAHPSGPIGLYEHSRATNTCLEKIELLNKETNLKWEPHQAIKAPFFQDRVDDPKKQRDTECLLYCFVMPELGKEIDTLRMVERRLIIARQLLGYMQRGTCTPFISSDDGARSAGRVLSLYVHHDPKMDHTLVDVSVGGTSADAHKLSVWMPYGSLRKLLRWNLGDIVIPCSFHYLDAKAAKSKSFIHRADGVTT